MNLEKLTDFAKKSATNLPIWLGVVALVSPLSAPAAEIDEKSSLNAAQRQAEPVVAKASAEGEQAIQRFDIQEGFTVDLVASEPQLANPVAFAIDHKGRFYTSETYRYRSSVL